MPTSTVAKLLGAAADYEKQGNFKQARDILRQAIEADDKSLAIDVRLRLGNLCLSSGEPYYHEAESVLEAARQLAKASAFPRQEANAIHFLALRDIYRTRFAAAATLLTSCSCLSQAHSPGIETGQHFHYDGLLLERRDRDLEQAQRKYFRAYAVYKEADYTPGLAAVCDSIANVLLQADKTNGAVRFAKLSLAHKETLGDLYGQAISLGTLGRIHFVQAHYNEAADAFSKDLEIAEALGDARGIGLALNTLGNIALQQQRIDQALAYFQRNLREKRGAANEIHARLGLANAYLADGRYENANSECDEAERLIEDNAVGQGLRDLLSGVRGALAWRQGHKDEGQALLIQAVDRLIENRFARDAVPYLYELRDLYRDKGEIDEAVAVLAKALDILSRCDAEQGVRDAENWLRTVDQTRLIQLALQSHMPKHLIAPLLGGCLLKPPSETQEVTVLFSDVRGYTSWAASAPPEKIVEVLNEWFSEVTLIVERNGGIIDKFIGDAVMALFGVPKQRHDTASGAVRAALQMRDALRAMNLYQAALGEKELQIGIGIATGKAIVGYMGSYLRQSYTAIGEVVNTAARLESETKEHPGCDILIDEKTNDIQGADSVAETAFIASKKLRGMQQAINLYTVRGPISAAGR